MYIDCEQASQTAQPQVHRFVFALLIIECHRQAYEVKHVRNGSVKPLVHAMVGLCTLGYILNFGHLSSKLTTL